MCLCCIVKQTRNEWFARRNSWDQGVFVWATKSIRHGSLSVGEKNAERSVARERRSIVISESKRGDSFIGCKFSRPSMYRKGKNDFYDHQELDGRSLLFIWWLRSLPIIRISCVCIPIRRFLLRLIILLFKHFEQAAKWFRASKRARPCAKSVRMNRLCRCVAVCAHCKSERVCYYLSLTIHKNRLSEWGTSID